MIIINKENLARHSNLKSHAADELEQRMEFNAIQKALTANLTHDSGSYVKNAAGIFGKDYWFELDNQAIEIAGQERGREIFNDIQDLATVVPLGKTVRGYQKLGDISDHVTISMDMQTPQTFDHSSMTGDADPIPGFTAGYGINWRHWLGLQTENIDLMLQSQRAKLVKFYEAMADYALNGNTRIQEANYPGQGIKNHRNTIKIDLAVAGIDLTTATPAEIITYFAESFGAVLDNNAIATVKLWVSPQIRARMAMPYSDNLGIVAGSIEAQLRQFTPRISEIGTDYSLNGNEFVAYVKDKAFLEVPTGQAVIITPLPRLMPRENFNNDISSAFGIQVKQDSKGRSGVFYGANLT